ncbi:hypothetical protein LCGC14_2658170 [marine sediment metagenome]|uniref:Holin of 3TMs, for gene-transfer release n=1 Tax=marine sediment metagenome TaxID=412755 RepID=A0A0F8ZSQ3_9ZZZZ
MFGGGIGETAAGFGSLAKDLRTAITGVDSETQGKIELIIARLTELQASVVIAELQSGAWLAQNWRPITMLTFVFIIANNYILYPYLSLFWNVAPKLEIPPDMWGLLKIGLGGYVVGRSGEKIAKALRR